MIEALKEEASRLLQDGYDGIVGLRKKWGHVGPHLFTQLEELQDLEVEPRYPLAKFICQIQRKWPDRKLGAVVRGCDERALKELEGRGVFKKDGFAFIGVVCSPEQAEECNCEKPIYTTFQCSGCWKCIEDCDKEAITRTNVCPIIRPNEFDIGLSKRKAVYIPFPQAIPNKATREAEHCLKITGKLDCKGCENVCEAKAVVHEMQDEVVEEDIGAIVVATGAGALNHTQFSVYGGGVYPDVISSLQLERMMSAAGPTGGEVICPSNGAHPKNIVFISCVGSRDERTGNGYCSKVCCMYMAKHAIMLKEHDPEVQSHIIYTDDRGPGGKIFEDFLTRAEKAGTTYLRGRIDNVSQHNGKLSVSGRDFLNNKEFDIPADLVVLATGLMPSDGVATLFQTLHISYDAKNYLLQAHPKLRPVETAANAIFIAGCAVAPTDIPESVAQGGAAAQYVLKLFSQDTIEAEPMTSVVDTARCSGCLLCRQVCPFNAIDAETLRDGRIVASINESLCEGCGICVVACRPGAIKLRGFSDQQILAEVMAL